ncbi:uncharacterized protein LOC144489417 isoform X4 [Mustelus asterias]
MNVLTFATIWVMSYPVDTLTNGDWDAIIQSSEAYLARLRGRDEESTEWFSLTNGETLAVTPSSVTALHIHKEVPGHWIPALLNLRDKGAVVALYLGGRWWSLENALRTSNSARQGLVQFVPSIYSHGPTSTTAFGKWRHQGTGAKESTCGCKSKWEIYHQSVILEPSEKVASGSQARKGESSGESNVTEGEREESRSDTQTTTGRKRRDTGLFPASNSKQVKLTASPLCD